VPNYSKRIIRRKKSYKQIQRKLTAMGKEEEEPTFEELAKHLQDTESSKKLVNSLWVQNNICLL